MALRLKPTTQTEGTTGEDNRNVHDKRSNDVSSQITQLLSVRHKGQSTLDCPFAILRAILVFTITSRLGCGRVCNMRQTRNAMSIASVRARQALMLLEPFSYSESKRVEVRGLSVSYQSRPRRLLVQHYGTGICLIVDRDSIVFCSDQHEWQVALVTEVQRKIVRDRPDLDGTAEFTGIEDSAIR